MRMNLRFVGTIAKSVTGNGWKLLLNKPKEKGLLTNNVFEGIGWLANLDCLKNTHQSPDGQKAKA
jgi:hypothetical protein